MTAAPRGVARATARRKRVAWLVVDERGYPIDARLTRAAAEQTKFASEGESVVRVEYEWPARAGRSRMGGAR